MLGLPDGVENFMNDVLAQRNGGEQRYTNLISYVSGIISEAATASIGILGLGEEGA